MAADDEPAIVEVELGVTLAEEDAVNLAESLRLVEVDSGEVKSGSVQWLPGNRLRIRADAPLASGEYVLVPQGAISDEPTFGFRVTP